MVRRSRLAPVMLVSWLVLALAFVAAPGTARAEDPRDRTWFGTVYVGRWIASNLADVPRDIVTGELETERITFVSALANRVLIRELRTDLPLVGWLIDGGSIEVEGQLGWHFGRQRHAETSLALLWRSPDVTLPLTGSRVNFAIGEGLSYALSRPTFEGREDGERGRKFLNYLAVELEFSHPDLPGVSLVPRLHHRSGIFGLIAPQGGTGSNFIGLGLRVTLQ